MAREMKVSGVAWIGYIPKEWNIIRAKYIFKIIGGNGFPESLQGNNNGDYPFCKVSDINGNGIFVDAASNYISNETLTKYRFCLIPVHSILIAKIGVALLKNHRKINTVPCCIDNNTQALVPVRNDNIKYLYYLSKCIDMGWFNRASTVPCVDNNKLLDLFVPNVQELEQRRISAFLDGKCAEIDIVLEKTRTSIEEYKKLKQAIITQAVTKGVRGDRPMKESGIEWADAIPEEIKISRLGLHYDIILGKMLCSAQVDDSYTLEPYYCAADVHFEGISDSERKMMWFSPAEKELYHVQRNDLLVVEGGAGAGGCAVVTDKETPTYIQNSIMIVRAKHSGDCRYVRYWLECLVRQGYIDVVCNKATIPHFTKDKLAAVPYFVFSEQERNEISDYLDEQCRNINSQVEKKECLLHELESYKKSLIYEYVTGKKEVQQKQQVKEMVVYPFFPAVFQATNPRFAQAILMSKVLDSCKVKMGRVKLEKIMFVLESSIGFDFDTEYVREAAGPLDKSLYTCEGIISKRNKWFIIHQSKGGVSYRPTENVDKYKKYYDQYFSEYQDAINHVIDTFEKFDADQAEVIATLYGAWNDLIIDKRDYTDHDIVDEVLNHWHPKKRRFPRDMWLRAIQRMRELDLVPHGYGRHTIIKQN